MSLLEELKKDFPNAKREPRKDCKYCEGTGRKKKKYPCICIFVDHEFCDMAAESLRKIATSLKNKCVKNAERLNDYLKGLNAK